MAESAVLFGDFMLANVPPVLFWVFVGSAIIIQGISKSGFAGGAGILSLPLMMLVMPVEKVAATLLPLLILCDMNALCIHWRNRVWEKVLEIYVPSVIGIILGAAVWWLVGREGVQSFERVIRQFVGVLAVLFAIYIVGREAAMAWANQLQVGKRAAVPIGIAAGFCSTIAHAAGPIVGMYLFSQNLGKTLFVGSVAWTFTLINLTKLPFYVGVGLIRRDVLLFGLLLVWLIPIGSYLGKYMHNRVSESQFNRVILVLTLIAGVQLISGVNLVQTGYVWLFRNLAG